MFNRQSQGAPLSKQGTKNNSVKNLSKILSSAALAQLLTLAGLAGQLSQSKIQNKKYRKILERRRKDYLNFFENFMLVLSVGDLRRFLRRLTS